MARGVGILALGFRNFELASGHPAPLPNLKSSFLWKVMVSRSMYRHVCQDPTVNDHLSAVRNAIGGTGQQRMSEMIMPTFIFMRRQMPEEDLCPDDYYSHPPVCNKCQKKGVQTEGPDKPTFSKFQSLEVKRLKCQSLVFCVSSSCNNLPGRNN